MKYLESKLSTIQYSFLKRVLFLLEVGLGSFSGGNEVFENGWQ